MTEMGVYVGQYVREVPTMKHVVTTPAEGSRNKTRELISHVDAVAGAAMVTADFKRLIAAGNSRLPEVIVKPNVRNSNYDQAGISALFESGQLIKGDLSDEDLFHFKGEEIPMLPLVINIGTRRRPDYWTIKLPKNKEHMTIFVSNEPKPRI